VKYLVVVLEVDEFGDEVEDYHKESRAQPAKQSTRESHQETRGGRGAGKATGNGEMREARKRSPIRTSRDDADQLESKRMISTR